MCRFVAAITPAIDSLLCLPMAPLHGGLVGSRRDMPQGVSRSSRRDQQARCHKVYRGMMALFFEVYKRRELHESVSTSMMTLSFEV